MRVSRSDDRVGDREPEARARRCRVRTMEPIEDDVAFVDLNTGPAVFDSEDSSVTDDRDAHASVTAGAGEFTSVVNEHADQSIDRLRVGAHSRGGERTDELERDAVS